LEISAGDLNPEQAYRLLTGIIVPRPIAWITTMSPAGGVNLAPFSHFTFVSVAPPMLGISIGRRGESQKDTGENILREGDFVAHIADVNSVADVHRSAIEYPVDVSEVEILGLETLRSRFVKPPRLACAPIGLECRLSQCIELGRRRTRLVIGEIVHIHVRDGLMCNGKIETQDLRPLARLGGPKYATIGEIISMQPIPRTTKR